jgi:putative spermidine/putrescine transport system substrate-binding protein
MTTPTRQSGRMPSRMPRVLGAVLGAAALALVAGCGSSSSSGTTAAGGMTVPDVPMQKSLGPMEGQVNILAWPGYAEDGSNDPKTDWVTPFEKQTGCKANVKYFDTSDEAFTLMKSGGYDVVSASGDASLRLIASGEVAPVNTKLISTYDQIEPFLKNREWNSVNGQMYGVPHGWGANLLMYRTDKVTPAPTSWGAVFTDASKYKGKVTAYDSPIYIADAALYLMKTQPDLGIKDPYALDQKQLDAAVSLLKDQRANISEYWSDYNKEVTAFKSGSSVVGTTWKFIEQVAAGEKVPVASVLPTEGATGWSDTWMVSSKAKNPNCAYAWMSYITEPKPQSEVAQFFGEAPANGQACKLTGAQFCKDYHVTDKAFADQIWYWTTPISHCLDGRTDTQCTDYGQWTQAWTEIKG